MSAAKPRGKRFPIRSALLLLAVNAVTFGTVLLLLELALRSFPPAWLAYRMKMLRAGQNSSAEAGSDAGWKVVRRQNRFLSFAPNSELAMIHPEYQMMAHTDEYGGRKVVPRVEGQHTPFLGDSFTFGIGVEDKDCFVSLLQQRLSTRLLNLGVPGSALHSERFIAGQRHQELGNPKVWVFCFFLGNDFADVDRYRSEASAARASQKSQAPQLLSRMNELVLNSPLRRSYTLQFVRQPFLQLLNRRADARFQDPIFPLMAQANSGEMDRMRSEMNEELKELGRTAAELKFQPLFVLIPDRFQVDDQKRRLQARSYGIDPSRLDPFAPNKMLIELLETNRLPFIDVTAEMVRASAKAGDLYYVYDNHLTHRGHKVFADALAAPIEKFLLQAVAPGK